MRMHLCDLFSLRCHQARRRYFGRGKNDLNGTWLGHLPVEYLYQLASGSCPNARNAPNVRVDHQTGRLSTALVPRAQRALSPSRRVGP